jgi:hypothetical protein
MSGNIPGSGGSVLPGTFTDVVTQSRGASIPGGVRIAAIIGEGSRSEVIVSSALGGGSDGFNSTYTSTSGADGRHFVLSTAPVISNRTSLFRNGLPLVGLEEVPSSSAFSSAYDYRIDIDTGRIEMQKAFLQDLGGAFFTASTLNVGDGYIANLTLSDVNAPSETWTIKCVSVQRTPLNAPIAGTAKFVAFGSISGQKLDANGNPVFWIANGTSATNGVLTFNLWESNSGATPLREGDFFTVKVKSGVLSKNDTLTASYIPTLSVNDPEFLQTPDDVLNKHGLASTDNTLALGCQLAFANSAPGIMCVQAAPAMARRTSFLLSDGVRALSQDESDFIFALPVGVQPYLDSQIHFFVKNNTTNVETQVLPNKFDYYQLDESGQPTTNDFIFDDTNAPSGYSFSYTVVSLPAAIATGLDGYLARNTTGAGHDGIFSGNNLFDSTYVGKTLKVIDANNVGNNGSFVVTAVTNGDLYFTQATFADFTSESSVSFELINPATGAALDDGVDGVLTNNIGTGTASFASASVDFTSFTPVGKRLQINGTDDNDGLYDITVVDGSDVLTIAKVFVEETDLRYEVIDTDSESFYVVINHNVVPNGYSLRVNLVDDRDASFYDTGWINALESLETQEIDILVALPKQTISAIFQNALNHCKTMSNIVNKKERVLFCGAISGLKPANLTGAQPAAVEDIGLLEGLQGDEPSEVLAGSIEDLTNYSVPDSFGTTFRSTYFYPDQIVVQAGTDNVLLDGFYIAAAAAGYLSASTNVAIPLTNKTLSGFTILRSRQYSNLVLTQLVEAGVTVLQPIAGGGRVIWGLTTTQSGFVEEREISIVFIRDRVAKSLRGAFNGFIGLPEDSTTIATLSARAIGAMNAFVSQGLITAFKDVNVERDSVDPGQWNIAVKAQPTYGINFIYIKVSLGLL